MRHAVLAATGALVFGFVWLYRFNDPGGSFAGLTDDHFFYVIRGWQILYGELPVRDFVDHGAPLYYYVAAAVQYLFGRGTLSELAFSVTMIALGATLTFWLAARASGSILCGIAGAAVHIWLGPRFYNYPKILVYTLAVPLLWWFADRPGARPRFWLAVATAVAFLFRHDHGVFVAIAFAALLLLLRDLTWRARLRHASIYGLLTLALLGPYLVFIMLNGGLGTYVQQASSWAARERERTEIVWPGLFDDPDGRSEIAEGAPTMTRWAAVVYDNSVAWWYYLELAIPFLAIAIIAMSRDAFRPGWHQAWSKIMTVAVLGIVLNAGFLRSPLDARLADSSVPHAILIAWLLAAIPAMFVSAPSWRLALQRWRMLLAGAVVALALPLALILGTLLTEDAYERIDSAAMAGSVEDAFARVGHVARTVRMDWQLATWGDREDRSELLTLAMYLNACTPPDARVFMQAYLPQVLALSRRGFAGGHADLRPGFFTSDEAQTLTVERLRRQHVPIALLETEGAYENFRESFPLIAAYFDEHYMIAGTHDFDGRFGLTLLLNRETKVAGRFPGLDWPCPSVDDRSRDSGR
jgi:hypothetical protein